MSKKTKPSSYFGMTQTQIIILLILSVSAVLLIAVIFLLFIRNNASAQIQPQIQTPSIIIAYINLSAKQTAENRVAVNGKTNLPDGTIIMVSVTSIASDFSGQDRVIVSNGTFNAGPFGSAFGLTDGKYTVQALMPYPAVQPASVQEKIGSNGERLAGEQVVYDNGVLVVAKKEFAIIVPTPTFLPLPTATPTPIKIMLSGGDIGRAWSNDEHRVGLLSVYRTEMLDGVKPFGEWNGGYRGGFTQFLVVELQFERFSSGYEEWELSNFWLWSYSNDNYREYQADSYLYQSPNIIEVYYQETVREIIAFEVKPDSHNFILCYWTGIAVDISGKIVGECGAVGYQFKFGD